MDVSRINPRVNPSESTAPRFLVVEKWGDNAVIQTARIRSEDEVLSFCEANLGGHWMVGLWQMAITHRGRRYDFTQSNPICVMNNFFYLVVKARQS